MKSLFSSRITGLLAIIILYASFISCEKMNNSPENPLVGNWRSSDNFNTISFNNGNTFIKTAYFVTPDKPTEFKVSYKIQGEYSIDADNKLTYKNIRMTDIYTEPQLSGTIRTFESVNNFSLNGNNLTLEPISVFTRMGISNQAILGKWSSTKLIAVYDRNSSEKFSGGYGNFIYEFKTDKTVTLNYEYFFNSKSNSYSENQTYNYSIPNLDFSCCPHVVVAFETSDNMIWTYTATDYIRE